MINRNTGELHFSWGQRILPHSPLPSRVIKECRAIPVQDWVIFMLGTWPSTHGPFSVGVAVDSELRIQGVALCHWLREYRQRSINDPVRTAYHESIILADLAGQREFPWGNADCRYDPVENRSWLVVTYGPGPKVPLSDPEVLSRLVARRSARRTESDEVRETA